MNDSDLLIQFTQGSGKAFAEVVRRHVDLVFGAALRQVAGDRHLAEDIAQQVFIDLARKARTLTNHPTLTGWLYSSTRYAALNILRSEQRRAAREKQFDAMNTLATGSEPRWEQIRPVIDDALQELDDEDRHSLLLRFFGQQPLAAVAAQVGITENAAQKRVDRALDRLAVVLRRRGISSTTVALSLVLGEACVAAPAALAGTVTAAALGSTASLGMGTVAAGWLKIAAVVTAAVVIGWVGVKQAQPAPMEQKAALPPQGVDAKPKSVEVAPSSGPAAGATPAIAPIRDKPVERIAPLPTSPRKIYVVARADTLNRIARTVGVLPAAVRAENDGYNFAQMRVGDRIWLPANATIPPPPVVQSSVPIPADQLYLVQPGDTLQKIARKKDLLPEELEMLNPETNWERLQVGQPIRAP